MSTVPNEATIRFQTQVKDAIMAGLIDNHNDLVEKLNWSQGVMSAVMNNKRNVPKHILSLFNKFLQEKENEVLKPSEADSKKVENAINNSVDNIKKLSASLRLTAKLITEIKNGTESQQDISLAIKMADKEKETILAILDELEDRAAFLARELKICKITLKWRMVPLRSGADIIGYRDAETGKDVDLEGNELKYFH